MNWFGLHNGVFIGEPPAYVDKSKEPGRSIIPIATPLQWLQRSPFVLVTSPNLPYKDIQIWDSQIVRIFYRKSSILYILKL